MCMCEWLSECDDGDDDDVELCGCGVMVCVIVMWVKCGVVSVFGVVFVLYVVGLVVLEVWGDEEVVIEEVCVMGCVKEMLMSLRIEYVL